VFIFKNPIELKDFWVSVEFPGVPISYTEVDMEPSVIIQPKALRAAWASMITDTNTMDVKFEVQGVYLFINGQIWIFLPPRVEFGYFSISPVPKASQSIVFL
jgi:hypothetical protein